MTPLFDAGIQRRGLILGAAPAALFLGAGGAAGAAPPGKDVWRPDFDNAQDNVEAYMKLTSTLSNEVVMGWFSGHVFTLVDGQLLRPLMGLEGFGVGGARRNADGSYSTTWKEVGYYKDLATDRIISNWLNPLNDTQTEVLHIHNAGVNSTIAASFHRFKGGPPKMGEAKIEYGGYRHRDDPAAPFILPWFRAADSISLWMDVSAVLPNPMTPSQWPRESSGPTIRIAEQALYTAKAADLFDPARTSVDYVGAWNRLSPWLPWMLMGQAPGGLLIRATTRRLRSYDEVPRQIYDYTAEHYPDYLNPVVDTTRPNESSWEVFMKERKPSPPK